MLKEIFYCDQNFLWSINKVWGRNGLIAGKFLNHDNIFTELHGFLFNCIVFFASITSMSWSQWDYANNPQICLLQIHKCVCYLILRADLRICKIHVQKSTHFSANTSSDSCLGKYLYKYIFTKIRKYICIYMYLYLQIWVGALHISAV